MTATSGRFAGNIGADPLAHLPGKHDQSSHGRRRGLRSSLVRAKTVDEIASVVAAEASAIVGDTVSVSFAGADVEVARQFSEGLLRGVQRYPAAPLREIGTYGRPGSDSDTPNARDANADPDLEHATAFTQRAGAVPGARMPNGNTTTGTAIYLNVSRATPAHWQDRARTAELERTGVLQGRLNVAMTPQGVAFHEFAHSIAMHGRPSMPEYEVGQVARRLAAAEGLSVRGLTGRISGYATTDDAELTAEAFTDVMVNGAKAVPLSKELFAVMETNVRGWEQDVSA